MTPDGVDFSFFLESESCCLLTGQNTIQVPWQLSVKSSQYIGLAQAWCWKPAWSNHTISGSAIENWQALSPGAETKLGYVVECAGATAVSRLFVPQSVAVNNTACLISQEPS